MTSFDEAFYPLFSIVHGAVDGLLMTTIYPTLQLLTTNVKAKQLLWSLTLFVIGVGQVVGLPMAGEYLSSLTLFANEVEQAVVLPMAGEYL